METAESLDDHYFGLADDFEGSCDDHQRKRCNNAEKDQACHTCLRDLGAVNMQKKTPPWYSTTAFCRLLLLFERSILALSECKELALTRTLSQNRQCATQLSVLRH